MTTNQPNKTIKTNTKLNNIQVLRAFAAVVVVVFHSGYHFPHLRSFGSFGVDVFFIISGYIMARILDPHSGSSSDYFFRRRLLRIVPPYWFFTFLFFFVSLMIPPLRTYTGGGVVNLLKSLFFIPFMKSNGLIQPFLFIGWSLNYEMYFYLALAVGLLILRRQAVWIAAGLVLATMLACMPFADRSVVARFYARDVMVEFVLGIVCYYVCRAVPEAKARKLRLLSLLVCAVSALLLIVVQSILPEVEVSRVLTLGIPAFFLVTSASLLSQGGWDTNLTWLVVIGDASYILYLIHPYCEFFFERVLGRHHRWLETETATGALISVTFCVVLAVVLHVYGERPVVRLLNRNFGGKRKSVEFASPALP